MLDGCMQVFSKQSIFHFKFDQKIANDTPHSHITKTFRNWNTHPAPASKSVAIDPAMKRTIDSMIRHHHHHHQRESSISTLGSASGDWGSDIGAMFEEMSLEDHSNAASDHSRRMRAVTGVAILASTSPEIKALSLRRGNSFPQPFMKANMLPSPCSSVASNLSRTNLSVHSFYGDGVDTSMEETKFPEDDLTYTPTATPTKSSSSVPTATAANTPEHNRIKPPPSPKRTQLSDIASILASGKQENVPPNILVVATPPLDARGSHQKPRRSFVSGRSSSSLRDGSGSSSGRRRPPMPISRSMHRRVSFDSLPTPSEIGTSVAPSLIYSPPSDRTLSQTSLSISDRSLLSNCSERGGLRTKHRTFGIPPRSLNSSLGYF